MIWRYDNWVLDLFGTEILSQDGNSQQVIHWNIKESLNLHSMEVHRNYTVGAGFFNQICYQLGRNRVTGTSFPILTSVTIVRDNHIDAFCGGAFECIHHN
ncbi:hypothetical protein D3C71_1754320 [compost metagenome]